MGLTAAAAPAGSLVPVLATLAAFIVVLGLLALGAIILVRYRRPAEPPPGDQPELTDAWAEAGRRMKEQ